MADIGDVPGAGAAIGSSHDDAGLHDDPPDGHPDVLATPFAPTERFAVAGRVRAAAVWGALDCPSYPAEALRSGRFCLLGSLQANLVRPREVGEEFVVVGWTVGTGRRSTRTASAIIDQNGQVVASARGG